MNANTDIRDPAATIRPPGLEFGVDESTSPTPALRGVRRGAVGWTGAQDRTALPTALGYFSIGLGLMQILAPRPMTRLIGVRPGRLSSGVMFAMGVREIGHGVGILRNPKSKEWVATRVVGDLLDLGLLGLALPWAERPGRTLLAQAAVLGAAALDIRGAEALARQRMLPASEYEKLEGMHVRKSITLERPRSEVYGFWRDLRNLPRFMDNLERVEIIDERWSRWRAKGPAGSTAEWNAEIVEDRPDEVIAWRSENGSVPYTEGMVRFRDAPADRGTIVTVDMQISSLGGHLGSALLKAFRREPGQQIGDDLRRFKQVLETGEVVLSDASAERGLHPARPTRQPPDRQSATTADGGAR